MENFELFIDQDLLNPNFEADGEQPLPVWKLYARVNDVSIFEYTKENWSVQLGAQKAQEKIGETVTGSRHLNEDWKRIK